MSFINTEDEVLFVQSAVNDIMTLVASGPERTVALSEVIGTICSTIEKTLDRDNVSQDTILADQQIMVALCTLEKAKQEFLMAAIYQTEKSINSMK